MTDHDQHEIINAERVRRCQSTLEQYNDECDVPANLIDLLADARHWCDSNGKNYAEFDRIAYQHYLAEHIAGAGLQPNG